MIKLVKQQHDAGCFIACLAMLLDITYEEAFSRVYPWRIMPPFGTDDPSIKMPFDECMAIMPRLGIELKFSGLRNVKSLKKRTSLIILRWHDMPSLSHTLVFDGERGVFVDPWFGNPLNHNTLNKNLLAIYYVKKVSCELSSGKRLTKRLMEIPACDTLI